MNDLVLPLELASLSEEATAFAELSQFAACIASHRELDGCVSQCVTEVARIFDAATCVILISGAEPDTANAESSVFTNHHRAPGGPAAEQVDAARRAAARALERGGSAQLSDAGPANAAMSAPIRIVDSMIGAVSVIGRDSGLPYTPADLHRLDIVSRFIGRAIEIIQLRCLLDSRFAQLALLHREGVGVDAFPLPAPGLPNPDQLARLVARSFYRELAKSGFCSRQIINAASEIVSQLTQNLPRRS